MNFLLNLKKNNYMKKIFSILIIATLFFTLTACKKQPEEQKIDVSGVPKTGRIIDISEQTGQLVIVTPGDVLYLKLEGESNSGKQWSVSKPTAGDYLMLVSHSNIGLTDPGVLEGKFKDEWSLKVEKTGDFDLEFIYGLPNQEPEKVFSVKIISQ